MCVNFCNLTECISDRILILYEELSFFYEVNVLKCV